MRQVFEQGKKGARPQIILLQGQVGLAFLGWAFQAYPHTRRCWYVGIVSICRSTAVRCTQLTKVDIRKAQKALGHKRIDTTARHYVLDDIEVA